MALDCSTHNLQMTCSERTGIIITSLLLFSLITALILFSRARLNSIRCQKEYCPQPPAPRPPPRPHSLSDEDEKDDDEFVNPNYSYAYEYRRWEIERKHNALKRTDKLVSFQNVLE